MSNKVTNFLYLILILSTNTTIAMDNKVQNKKNIDSEKNYLSLHGLHPVFTFTTGASLPNATTGTQSFSPVDLCHYNYKNNSTSTGALWGGFLGAEIIQTTPWSFVTGVGYYQPNTMHTQGTLTQGADTSSFSTYSYGYKIQSQQVLAEGRLVWNMKKNLNPFIMLGIGAAINKVSNYQTNVPPFIEFTPKFSDHTQTNFTYSVGPGVEYDLSSKIQLGISYRFTHLGSTNTGSGQIETIPFAAQLKQSHVYANQILAQVSFIPWNS